jgi:AraC family transcriptional regulator of adaptative response/methylated-DNA-[protein]-cysteine methyltransferase
MSALPPQSEMIRAFTSSDAAYEGIFITGVLTTGIFCRPTCPARKPKPENVTFFKTTKDALDGGFRPCKRCRPLESLDTPPEWVEGLLAKVDDDPTHRWKDQDLRNLGIEPERARRWFKAHHGMTFHAYSRARRLGKAMGHMKNGQSVTEAAFDAGYESLAGFTEAIKKFTGLNATTAADSEVVYLERIVTPVGPMLAGATSKAVVLLEFVDRPMLPTQLERIQKRFSCVFVPEANRLLEQMKQELEAYFSGDLEQFTVPLDFPGTEFQQKVWTALLTVPYGKTASYLDLATWIGDPKAVRAVARANGDNRIAIVIPCHRIIGSDGSLTGYGGGLHRKKKLLELEGGYDEPSLFD